MPPSVNAKPTVRGGSRLRSHMSVSATAPGTHMSKWMIKGWRAPVSMNAAPRLYASANVIAANRTVSVRREKPDISPTHLANPILHQKKPAWHVAKDK